MIVVIIRGFAIVINLFKISLIFLIRSVLNCNLFRIKFCNILPIINMIEFHIMGPPNVYFANFIWSLGNIITATTFFEFKLTPI